MDYITAQTPDKGVQIGPEPPISNDSMAMTPDKGVQIGKELPIIDASTALIPDKGVQVGPEPPISNDSIAMAPDKGVQVGPEPPISNDSIAMSADTIPGFGGNLIEAGIVLNGTKSAVYKSTAYPANADGIQRPGAVVEYSSEFSVDEGIGGGSTNTLPAGYLAADFLESTGTQYIIHDWQAFYNTPDIFDRGYAVTAQHMVESRYRYPLGIGWSNGTCSFSGPMYDSSTYNRAYFLTQAVYFSGISILSKITTRMNYKNSRVVEFSAEDYSQKKDLTEQTLHGLQYGETKGGFGLFILSWQGNSLNSNTVLACRIWNASFTEGDKVVHVVSPAVDVDGKPCMYDKILKKAFYNKGTGSFIVGFTLAQARKLSALPATGGTLTISLPEGYEADEGVANALETARSNGWTLTIQTYTPETATAGASTFALRRIWVRRTQDEQGGYVDADGSRWQVDWCVDMLTPDGSTPDAHGYELYRSVDAAVAYWELTPYVDPEQEEEFSQEL